MPVALRRRDLRSFAGHRIRTRRHDHGRLGIAGREFGVDIVAVVGAVAGDGRHRPIHLVEQGTDLGAVVGILVGQHRGDDPLPVAAGTSHGTLRRHTLELGERLRDAATVEPDAADAAAAPAIALSLDATFIRGRHEGERHLEVRVGNAETPGGGRQLFGAVANAGTDIVALIRRTLDTMGRTSDTELTAFTDGCSSMRSILAEAGVTDPPILDWFHLSMRLQHAKQAAGGLPADGPDRVQARAAIAAEVERLRWRTWNGKAKDARITLERIHALLPSFEGEPARKLRRALDAVDRYLRSQSAHLVNYAERHQAGLRVGTSLTEGTANFLVNRRMAKSQQMRWSRRGADLLLQVRCAVYNGTLGTGFGQRFQAANDPHPPAAIAA